MEMWNLLVFLTLFCSIFQSEQTNFEKNLKIHHINETSRKIEVKNLNDLKTTDEVEHLLDWMKKNFTQIVTEELDEDAEALSQESGIENLDAENELEKSVEDDGFYTFKRHAKNEDFENPEHEVEREDTSKLTFIPETTTSEIFVGKEETPDATVTEVPETIKESTSEKVFENTSQEITEKGIYGLEKITNKINGSRTGRKLNIDSALNEKTLLPNTSQAESFNVSDSTQSISTATSATALRSFSPKNAFDLAESTLTGHKNASVITRSTTKTGSFDNNVSDLTESTSTTTDFHNSSVSKNASDLSESTSSTTAFHSFHTKIASDSTKSTSVLTTAFRGFGTKMASDEKTSISTTSKISVVITPSTTSLKINKEINSVETIAPLSNFSTSTDYTLKKNDTDDADVQAAKVSLATHDHTYIVIASMCVVFSLMFLIAGLSAFWRQERARRSNPRNVQLTSENELESITIYNAEV